MQRKIIQELIDWKHRADRRPLVVRGARQVGKTYLVEHFAHEHFQNLVCVNFDKTPEKKGLLQNRNVSRRFPAFNSLFSRRLQTTSRNTGNALIPRACARCSVACPR